MYISRLYFSVACNIEFPMLSKLTSKIFRNTIELTFIPIRETKANASLDISSDVSYERELGSVGCTSLHCS